MNVIASNVFTYGPGACPQREYFNRLILFSHRHCVSQGHQHGVVCPQTSIREDLAGASITVRVANDRKIGAALEAMHTSTSEKSSSRTPLTGVRLKTQDRCVDMSTAGTDREMPRLSNTSATVISPNTSVKADRRAWSPARTNRRPLKARYAMLRYPVMR